MANPYSTGPAWLSVNTGEGGDSEFFGCAEARPRISIRPHFSPVYTDIGGEAPFDMQYMGEEAYIYADINYYTESVLLKLQSRPSVNGEPGLNEFGDVGTFMALEEKGVQLSISFPYASKSVFSDMPKGYRFYMAFLVGPDEMEVGTKYKRNRCVFHAIRVFDAGEKSFRLYDNDVDKAAGPAGVAADA